MELLSQAIFHIINMDILMAIGLSYFSEQWEGMSKGIQSVKHLTPTILMTTVDYCGQQYSKCWGGRHLPILKIQLLCETIGSETQQRHTSKTLNEEEAKKASVNGSTNVEKKGLKVDKVGHKYLNYDSSLCRKCSMSHNNSTDSIHASVATDGTVNSAEI